MDEKRPRAMKRSEGEPLDDWLAEALAPAPGAAERAVAAALRAQTPTRRSLLPLAAAALLALALGVSLLTLRPPPRPQPPRGGRAPRAAPLLITNASGETRLVRSGPELLPPPLPRRPAGGGCTTVLFNRGNVLAVYESCGPTAVRIEGGAS